jgi:DNA repair ATPase RecN
LEDAQRARLDARQADQDRTLAAMHTLEAALGAAAPGRLQEWREVVLSTLAVVEDASEKEAANATRADSLLSDIARTQPRLRNRVRGVRLQYGQLREALHSLREELSQHPGDALDFADVRQRLSWVLTSLRYQRARESDLIYEAYFDAFRSDLRHEAGWGGKPGG